MDISARFKQDIFNITTENFENYALEAFHFQSVNNPVYRQYLSLLDVNTDTVQSITHIPFMPIELFKSHTVSCKKDYETVFQSSGTTGQQRSQHHIADLSLYDESILKGFNSFYGRPEDNCILALLPSYLEQSRSSLVYMVDWLIQRSGHADSGFYLHDYTALHKKLQELEREGQKTLLIGVSFALLELAESYTIQLDHTIIMETGGMKGRREEITRQELHEVLKKSFHKNHIHSEYGMTELLSQAYSRGEGVFQSPPWMKVLISDMYDPLQWVDDGTAGIINIIDLANINSCCFIKTADIGKRHVDGRFEVLGRFDNSDVRGCNLMLN